MKILIGWALWNFISPLFRYNTAFGMLAIVAIAVLCVFIVAFIAQLFKGNN